MEKEKKETLNTQSMLHTRATLCQYSKTKLETSHLPLDLEQIQTQLKKSKNNWIHVTGLNNVGFITSLCLGLGIHNLVIEDLLTPDQRVKAERYENYLFVVLRLMKKSITRNSMQYEQISLILLPGLLLSFSAVPLDLFDDIAERMKRPHSKIRALNADYLMYAIFDALVDDYMTLVEAKGNILEKIEAKLIINPAKISLNKLYQFRRELSFLRRYVLSLRDISTMLLKNQSVPKIDIEESEVSVISLALNHYLQDVYDHVLRTLETIDIFREVSNGMLEFYSSSMNHKLNERLNFLTIFSTIFIPLTFITGIFGMNFKLLPGINSPFGFVVTILIMLVIAGGLLSIFKIKHWL